MKYVLLVLGLIGLCLFFCSNLTETQIKNRYSGLGVELLLATGENLLLVESAGRLFVAQNGKISSSMSVSQTGNAKAPSGTFSLGYGWRKFSAGAYEIYFGGASVASFSLGAVMVQKNGQKVPTRTVKQF